MRGRCWVVFWGGLMSLALLAGEAPAGVFSATLEDVSLEDLQITVKISRRKKPEQFKVRASADITVDGKPVALSDLKSGQVATVTTNKLDEVVKIAVRANAKPKPDEEPSDPAEKSPDKPDPTDNDGGDPAPAAEEKAVTFDWPQFRGPNRDNRSCETGLLTSWPQGGPRLAWKQTGIGLGYSSVAVADGKIFTMGNLGDQQWLIALDEATGEHLWKTPLGPAFHQNRGDGPRGTPTVDGDRVYALGGSGELACVGKDQGAIVWQVNILEQFGGSNIKWGISESVLIDGDRLICTPGGRKATVAALDKLTGEVIWRSNVPNHPKAAYSSPIAIEVGGVRQYANFVQTAVIGVRAEDGQPLWGNPKSANGTANCSSPLFADDALFSASGYGTGGALVELHAKDGQTTATLAYATKQMKNHHGGMALVDGYIYGFDDQILTCLEFKTGKMQWQDRSVGKGSLVVADGHLYLRSEHGPVALAEVTPKQYVETGRFDQPDRSDKPSWAHPVVANGRLYLRDMDTLLAYDVKK
jgi:outer membrane protein assembly factor BamB